MPSQKATFDTVAGRSGAMVQHFYCRLSMVSTVSTISAEIPF